MPALTDRDDILHTVLDASPCRDGAATPSQTIWAPGGPAAASVACYRCGERTAAVVGLMRIDSNIAASSLIDGSLGLAQRLLLSTQPAALSSTFRHATGSAHHV
jgi:hypothetical protein